MPAVSKFEKAAEEARNRIDGLEEYVVKIGTNPVGVRVSVQKEDGTLDRVIVDDPPIKYKSKATGEFLTLQQWQDMTDEERLIWARGENPGDLAELDRLIDEITK